jgi:hypothetical protein
VGGKEGLLVGAERRDSRDMRMNGVDDIVHSIRHSPQRRPAICTRAGPGKSQMPLPEVATHTPSALMCRPLRRMAAGTPDQVSFDECLQKSCEQEDTPL